MTLIPWTRVFMVQVGHLGIQDDSGKRQRRICQDLCICCVSQSWLDSKMCFLQVLKYVHNTLTKGIKRNRPKSHTYGFCLKYEFCAKTCKLCTNSVPSFVKNPFMLGTHEVPTNPVLFSIHKSAFFPQLLSSFLINNVSWDFSQGFAIELSGSVSQLSTQIYTRIGGSQ